MIRIDGLSKKFGARTVLDHITLRIPAGQATGIVGPNGSGKTTMIKTILGLVRPDEGTVTVNGSTLNGHWDYRRDIGYMPQTGRYPENMTVRELINFIKKVRQEETAGEEQLIRHFGLEKEQDKRLRVLSGGMRQKTGAVLAMMFDPKILILDEPTAGLDPSSSVRLKKLIHEEKKRGKTVLLTTHIMSEIEELADYLVLLVEGTIRYHGPMNELLDVFREERLEEAVAKMLNEEETV